MSPPPEFAHELVNVFRAHDDEIATEDLDDGLKSDAVLAQLRDDLTDIGVGVEAGKKKEEKIFRPVLFGESGELQLQYEVDAYHPDYGCGLEVEAGRAWKGNAISGPDSGDDDGPGRHARARRAQRLPVFKR